uniref:Small monomeric GTPase n=1 Tax=Arcella intermedia TaxID=1963864 RepID=A0A6B2LLM0_9EUKA
MVGENGVGKSCISLQFIQHRFEDNYDSTIEDSWRKRATVDGECYLYDIYDTVPSPNLDTTIRICQGFLVVFSLASKESFQACIALHDRISLLQDLEPNEVPFVLCGNKCDLEDSQRQVSTSEAEETARAWGCPYLETSALRRTNIDESFHQIVREINKINKKPTTDPNTSKRTCHLM